MSGWGSKKPSQVRGQGPGYINNKKKVAPSIADELFELQEDESDEALKNMTTSIFVNRVQLFSKLVDQIRVLQQSRSVKKNSTELRQKRIEANAEANKLKKVKMFKSWAVKNVQVNSLSAEEENERKVIRRAVQELDKTFEELKNLIESAKNELMSQKKISKPNETEAVLIDVTEEQNEHDLDQHYDLESYGGSKQVQESEAKERLTGKLVDWQSSTLKVEHQIARESYEKTVEMSTDYTELKFLFENFNDMVEGQDEYIDKIGVNVHTAHVNVERGVEEIKMANQIRKDVRFRSIIVWGLILAGAALAAGCVMLAIFLPNSS
ncbi:1 TM domain-containing transmembrane protein [Acrasis kona]|uniref:1 TM domain-containing transmembrane protein n=1 Tax=Acrasis kona TaxID=1008807 RepID=A0AAW2YPK7_9EUKA